MNDLPLKLAAAIGTSRMSAPRSPARDKPKGRSAHRWVLSASIAATTIPLPKPPTRRRVPQPKLIITWVDVTFPFGIINEKPDTSTAEPPPKQVTNRAKELFPVAAPPPTFQGLASALASQQYANL